MNEKLLRVFEAIKFEAGREISTSASPQLGGLDMKFLNEKPTEGVVEQLLPTLKARLRNAVQSDKITFGLATLVENLERLRPDVVLFGYSYIAPDILGVAYFDKLSEEVIGIAFAIR